MKTCLKALLILLVSVQASLAAEPVLRAEATVRVSVRVVPSLRLETTTSELITNDHNNHAGSNRVTFNVRSNVGTPDVAIVPRSQAVIDNQALTAVMAPSWRDLNHAQTFSHANHDTVVFTLPYDHATPVSDQSGYHGQIKVICILLPPSH